jgi:eukaryotic-like serine/threonine-protein kinase
MKNFSLKGLGAARVHARSLASDTLRNAVAPPAPVYLRPVETSNRAVNERPTILFLDDEDRILNALAALFRYKYQVFTATTGEQALAILKQFHVHVVVSDQRMPEMTGVEFLRRAKRVSPNTVRILLTGFSDLSAIIESVNDGEVYRFLNKPWGNQEIQAVIADALSISLSLAGSASIADEPPARPAESVQSEAECPAVLMLHDKRETFERMRPLLNQSHPFVYAESVDACLNALQSHSVGVVVSDLQVGRNDTSELLKLLKQQHPHILTIVLAESADADLVVELINQAKIFRYVLSPCKPQKLKFFIDSALTQFQRYRSKPELLVVQKVEIKSDAARSRTATMISERLRSLRALFTPRAPAR